MLSMGFEYKEILEMTEGEMQSFLDNFTDMKTPGTGKKYKVKRQ